jgi:hypothetical protein
MPDEDLLLVGSSRENLPGFIKNISKLKEL